MQKTLIAIVLCVTLLLLTAFCFFCAIRYCAKDEIPEKVFMFVCGIMSFAVAVVSTIGILSV